MVKRAKRLEKGIESLKEEIEKHFKKIEEDISLKNMDRGRYHIKEIEKSLLKTLELKLTILGLSDDSLKDYMERLEELKKQLL